jgi:hypothetical protein
MKKLLSTLLALVLASAVVPVSNAEPRQVVQGTQVHLKLLSSIGTAASRNGDTFVAIVTQPVFINSLLVIPAGTRVNGTIGTVAPPRHFALVRGEAYMDVTFRSMEVDSRIIPVQMSILAIEMPIDPSIDRSSDEGPDPDRDDPRPRRDMKIDEGGVVQEKHDYKGDVLAATIGTGGGSAIGAVVGHVVRGFGIGLAGSAVYVASRKGRDVKIPAQSGMLVRMDNTITVPVAPSAVSSKVDSTVTVPQPETR